MLPEKESIGGLARATNHSQNTIRLLDQGCWKALQRGEQILSA
jgi:hypothetical protein